MNVPVEDMLHGVAMQQLITKEQYESYTPVQRIRIAKSNGQTVEELDEKIGITTDFPIGELRSGGEKFPAVSKDQYISYTPMQRFLISKWNGCSVDECDALYGVKTELPENINEIYSKRSHEICKIVLKHMGDAGMLKMPENMGDMPKSVV